MSIQTTDPTTTTEPPDTGGGFAATLNSVLKAAPELGQSPGLSVGVAQAGGDVTGNAQSVARGTQAIAGQKALNDTQAGAGGSDITKALDWFGDHLSSTIGQAGSDVLHAGEQVGSKVLQTLNKPLQMVQHEYRYLHDVEARHGFGAAVLEGLAMGAAAAGGLALTGSAYGAVLGAEGAEGLMGQFFYNDSWQRTTDGNTYVDPHTHQPVSFGRDVISTLSHIFPALDPGTQLFKLASGTVDGIADLNVGGTEVLGLASKANDLTGLGGTLGARWGGTGAATAEDVQRAYDQYGSVRRAFSELASKTPGEIALDNQYLSISRNAPLLAMVGNAHTQEEVLQVFKDAVRTNELAFSGRLPTMSITRMPFHEAYQMFKNSELPGVQRLARNITNLADAWDEVAKAFTDDSFNPASQLDNGAVAIGRIARSTESQRTAANLVNEYLTGDLNTRINIYRNLTLSTLFNMAGFRGQTETEVLARFADDPETQRKIAQGLDRAIAGGMFGREAVYGLDAAGRNLSLVRDSQGDWTYGAAITKNQTGQLRMLDLGEARRMAKTLANARDYVGRADDFLYDHVTAALFKPLALLTPSYALHISLAELIPNTLRLGLTKIASSTMRLYGAKTAMKFEDSEATAIANVMSRLLGTNLDDLSEARLTKAAYYVLDHDGHLGPVGTQAAHGYQGMFGDRGEEMASLLRKRVSDIPKNRATDAFTTYGVDSNQHTPSWQAWLHEVAHDDASQLAARRMIEGAKSGESLDEATGHAGEIAASWWRHDATEADRAAMIRSMPNFTSYSDINMRPAGEDNFDEWGRVIAHNVRGAVSGADGTVHASLLSHVAQGESVPEAELNAIETASRPILVKGRVIVPDGSSKLSRIAEVGFRRVLNPMVNFLSRYPITFAEYEKQLAFLQPAVDKGIMDEEMARSLADQRAVQMVVRNIHNLTDRTQWTVTFRNWAPFFFAQEQAYRRFGRLLGEDPAAFRKYQLMITNMHNVGQVFAGPNGQGYFVMPGTGFMTNGAAMAANMIDVPVDSATPVGMGWNLSSSSVIFPLSAGFRPDIGPLVSVPVTAVAQLFPESLSPVLKSDLSAAASTVLGPAASDSWYAQMVPNTVIQRLLTATGALNQRSFNSTFMQTLATLDYEHKIPPPSAGPRAMQVFLDRVRNQTRIMYVMKAIVGAVTPVSPELTDQTYNQFTGELAAMIQKHKSVAGGIQEFLSKYPDATPFTVFQSQNLTGATVPDSVGAEKWINDNYALINKYPSAALLLMPMNIGTTYNAAVYNEQIAQGLRAKLAPDQYTQNGQVPSYIDQLYIAAGNSIVLDHWLPQFEKQIAGMTGSEKYTAEQAFYGDNQIGSGTLGKYGLQNPVWWNWWSSDRRGTQRAEAIQQMKTMLASGEIPNSPIVDDARVLLNGYANYENQIAVGSQDGFIGQSQSAINAAWKEYLVNAVQQNPDLANLINGLFLSVTAQPPTKASPSTAPPGQFNARSWNKAA